MSTSALVLVKFWPALRRVLMSIGRWLLETVARRGPGFAVGYCHERILVFRKRLKRAASRLRKKWLRSRIRRWGRAAVWFRSKEATQLTGNVVQLAMKKADRAIPEDAPDESFRRWARRQRRAA